MGLFKQAQSESAPVDEVAGGAQSTDGTVSRTGAPEDERELLVRERIQLIRERDELVDERDHLRGELNALLEERDRLEAELARYRAHAERTSKLFLHASDYATWMRENARRDAEVALRKSRARADEILGEVVRERQRAESELLRLQALASETRARLKEFTMDALRLLEPPDEAELEPGAEPGAEPEAEPEPEPEPHPGELQDVLQRELVSSRDRWDGPEGREHPEEPRPW